MWERGPTEETSTSRAETLSTSEQARNHSKQEQASIDAFRNSRVQPKCDSAVQAPSTIDARLMSGPLGPLGPLSLRFANLASAASYARTKDLCVKATLAKDVAPFQMKPLALLTKPVQSARSSTAGPIVDRVLGVDMRHTTHVFLAHVFLDHAFLASVFLAHDCIATWETVRQQSSGSRRTRNSSPRGLVSLLRQRYLLGTSCQ